MPTSSQHCDRDLSLHGPLLKPGCQLTGQGLEDSPWNTLEDCSSKNRLDIRSKEGEKDECDHQDERAEHCLFVADPFRNPAVEIQADDTTDLDQCQNVRTIVGGSKGSTWTPLDRPLCHGADINNPPSTGSGSVPYLFLKGGNA